MSLTMDDYVKAMRKQYGTMVPESAIQQAAKDEFKKDNPNASNGLSQATKSVTQPTTQAQLPMASNSPWIAATNANPKNSLSPMVNSVNAATQGGGGVVPPQAQSGQSVNPLLMKLLGNIPSAMNNQ